MLGKLIKHEFRATGAMIALICAGLFGFAGLTRLFMALDNTFGSFGTPIALSMFFYVVLAIAAMVLVYVIVIRRYYTNVYGDEGYLTLTLPVRRSDILLSKLTVGVVWMICCIAAMLLSALLLVYTDDFIQEFHIVYNYAQLWVSGVTDRLSLSLPFIVTVLILGALIGLIQTVLMLYASISIGQLFSKHRVIGSIIGYLALATVIRIVNSVMLFVFGQNNQVLEEIVDLVERGMPLDGMTTLNLTIGLIMYLVISALVSAGLFALSNIIMKRSVNLQ